MAKKNAKDTEARVAVLIDAENIAAKYFSVIMENLIGLGRISTKKVYADWNRRAVGAWQHVADNAGLLRIHNDAPTAKKNSSDFSLVIDAMDMLYADDYDTFVIVSSDSDFTSLVRRMHAAGKKVIGFMESKALDAYSREYDSVVMLDKALRKKNQKKAAARSQASERTRRESEKAASPDTAPTPSNGASKYATYTREEADEACREIIIDLTKEAKWADIRVIGTMLRDRIPGFSQKAFGYKKMSDYLAALSGIESRTYTRGTQQTKIFDYRPITIVA